MTVYNSVAQFGTLLFSLGDVQEGSQPSTLKTNIGKTFIEKNIPLRNTKDVLLSVSGIITGLSRTAGQSLSDAIEADRASLIVLDDGTFHTWSDGKHSGAYAIKSGSLVWNDEADRENGEPNKFTVRLVEWN